MKYGPARPDGLGFWLRQPEPGGGPYAAWRAGTLAGHGHRKAAALALTCIVRAGEVPVMTGPHDPAAAGRGRLRAGHAEREQAIDTLKTAFVHGQLTKDEFLIR